VERVAELGLQQPQFDDPGERAGSLSVKLSDEARKEATDNLKFSQVELDQTIRRALEINNLLAEQYDGGLPTIEVTVTSVRVRSSFSAIMFGFMAGDDHIDGDVAVRAADGSTLQKFSVSASYALGGLAGGQDSSRLGWLYETFAEHVTEELTGQSEEQLESSRAKPKVEPAIQSQQSGLEIEQYDGQWNASDGPWTAELNIVNGQYRLEARCVTEGSSVDWVGAGTLDAQARIPTTILQGSTSDPATAGGTIEELSILGWSCPQGRLRFARDETVRINEQVALVQAECISTECEAKGEQATDSLPDTQADLQEFDGANGASTQSPESQVAAAPGEEQQAALPEADDEIDGEWVLEIREPSYMPSGDKVTVNVVDGRFTANVSANGWRGSVSGRIDRSGILVASGYLRNPPRPSALLKWSSEPSGNRYNAKIPAITNWLSMTFEVSLSRSAKRSDDESANNL
jgi:hypothetical protein